MYTENEVRNPRAKWGSRDEGDRDEEGDVFEDAEETQQDTTRFENMKREYCAKIEREQAARKKKDADEQAAKKKNDDEELAAAKKYYEEAVARQTAKADEEMSDKPAIRNYAERTKDAFFGMGDLAHMPAFIPAPTPTGDAGLAGLMEGCMLPSDYLAQVPMPDGSGTTGGSVRVWLNSEVRNLNADKEARAEDLQTMAEVKGGWVEYSPSGVPVRLTERGQREGGPLMEREERAREEEGE